MEDGSPRYRLNHGAHWFANALGHISVVPDGEPCNCGLRGCLETYANAAALLHYAGGRFTSARDVIEAANRGEQAAGEAVRRLSRYLAQAVASMVQLLDPELIVLAGGLVECNPLLVDTFAGEIANLVTVPDQRKLRISTSKLGYHAGVLGAAAVVLERARA
jgi:glucokinase